MQSPNVSVGPRGVTKKIKAPKNNWWSGLCSVALRGDCRILKFTKNNAESEGRHCISWVAGKAAQNAVVNARVR